MTVTEGATRDEVETETVPAAPVVTVTRTAIGPLVVEAGVPGAPIVTTEVHRTAETCVVNPSAAAKRGNSC